MKITRDEAIRLAEAVEKIWPDFAAELREAASKYTHVIVTVT